MPYIPKEDRPQYDALVDPLAEKFRALGSNDSLVGPLNYAVSRLAGQLCGHGGERRYVYAMYDAMVDPLTEQLGALRSNDDLVGPLNYTVSRLTWQLCGHGGGERRYARMNAVVGALDCAQSDLKAVLRLAGGLSERDYARLNAVVGALDCAKSELKRRIIAPYEDEKIEEAGDVEVRPGE